MRGDRGPTPHTDLEVPHGPAHEAPLVIEPLTVGHVPRILAPWDAQVDGRGLQPSHVRVILCRLRPSKPSCYPAQWKISVTCQPSFPASAGHAASRPRIKLLHHKPTYRDILAMLRVAGGGGPAPPDTRWADDPEDPSLVPLLEVC